MKCDVTFEVHLSHNRWSSAAWNESFKKNEKVAAIIIAANFSMLESEINIFHWH